MDGRQERSARIDAAQFHDLALSVVVFVDGGDTRFAVLAPYLAADLLFRDIHCQLYLVISAYYSIQVTTLDDYQQEELISFQEWCIFYAFVVLH